MTAEQAIENWSAYARALREEEVRHIMTALGCDRERAEKLRVWLHDDEVVVGGLRRVERSGFRLGERLASVFRPLASLGSRYRT